MANWVWSTPPVQPTHYDFDGNDNLTKVTQTLPWVVTQERVFKYDGLSRLTHERQVEATATLDSSGVKGAADPTTKWTGYYKYTPDGLLDYGVDARGVKTDFTYDGLNRVKEVEYSGEVGYTTPKVIYTYSEARNDAGGQPYRNNGRLTTIETLENVAQGTPKTVQRYDVDSVGQVKRHRQTIGANEYELEYGYNLAGQLTSKKYPSGRVVNMTVDNFGVVQTVADSQRTYVNGVTSAYTASGMTSQVTLGNGTTESYTLNERFQLTSQSLKRGAEVLQKFDYAYGQTNAAGEITPNSNNGQLAKIETFIGAAKQRTQKFTYDSIGRLKKSEELRGDTNAMTYKQVFDYDRLGNLYRKAADNPTTGQQNPLPDTPIEDGDINKAKNQFATGTTYDEAGQVIQDNKFRSMGFAYDANGRVVKATAASTPDAHTVYDALGNRVATKINDVWQYVIYDAFGKLIAEYGVASEGNGGVKYIQQDWQGSVRTVTTSNGFVVSRTDYQAFGETIGAGTGLRNLNQGYGIDPATSQGYGRTENDSASGQQHTWFRKLETQAGRWSSADPYNGSMRVGDPQSFNRYSYTRNEPTNYVDPSGLQQMICMIDGMQTNCSTAFGIINNGGPIRVWSGDGYVSVSATLGDEQMGFWYAGGILYRLDSNILLTTHQSQVGVGIVGREPIYDREEREKIRKTSDGNPPQTIPCVAGTVQIGIHGTGALGFVIGTGGFGVAVDGSGNVGLYTEGGGGLGFGIDGRIGIQGEVSNANQLNGLEGLFVNAGGGGGAGASGSVAFGTGTNSYTGEHVGTVAVSGGGGAGASGGITFTHTSFVGTFNVWDRLGFRRSSQNGCR